MKILWFQKGIKDKSMEPIKASIVVQTSNPDSTTYTTFQAVQEAYTAFYRQQTGNDPPRPARFHLCGVAGRLIMTVAL